MGRHGWLCGQRRGRQCQGTATRGNARSDRAGDWADDLAGRTSDARDGDAWDGGALGRSARDGDARDGDARDGNARDGDVRDGAAWSGRR